VGYKTYGKVHEYFPEISRQSYFRTHIKSLINNHFDGSVVSFASFLTGDQVDLGELEEIRQLIDRKIETLKGDH
jgi:predicted transcriptional regulator